ncbi:MAG: caspase family protein [Bacteroidales bacterium]|nr:MAG: caspase family protein [Bacteroidales bacterium]
MKIQKLTKLAFVALLAVLTLIGCSKKDDFNPVNEEQTSFSVRPDFATLDNRPADVIALHQITETEPVKLLENAEKGVKYALVIGISNYSGTANDLQYCDDDAIDWKARLVAEGYTVTSLIDLAATKNAIQSALTTLASKAIAGNEITFIYSGHGSSGNIISTDLYYISSSYFKTKFSGAKSTKMFFSFDACQIGAMATSLNATGRIIAVASNTTIYSYDGDATMKNGVFTYYQMKGFDSMGYIYVENDCSYACTQMKSWASSHGVSVAPSYKDSYTGSFNL